MQCTAYGFINADSEKGCELSYDYTAKITASLQMVRSHQRLQDYILLGIAVFGALVPWGIGLGVEFYLMSKGAPAPEFHDFFSSRPQAVSGMSIPILWALSFYFPLYVVLRDSSAPRWSKLISILLGLSSGLGFGAWMLAPIYLPGGGGVSAAIDVLFCTLSVGVIVFAGARVGLAVGRVFRFSEN